MSEEWNETNLLQHLAEWARDNEMEYPILQDARDQGYEDTKTEGREQMLFFLWYVVKWLLAQADMNNIVRRKIENYIRIIESQDPFDWMNNNWEPPEFEP